MKMYSFFFIHSLILFLWKQRMEWKKEERYSYCQRSVDNVLPMLGTMDVFVFSIVSGIFGNWPKFIWLGCKLPAPIMGAPLNAAGFMLPKNKLLLRLPAIGFDWWFKFSWLMSILIFKRENIYESLLNEKIEKSVIIAFKGYITYKNY